jgi:hypothetical protein
MKLISLFLTIAVFPMLLGQPAFSAQEDQYCNVRFNYCLNYPAALLTKSADAENTEGAIFTTANQNFTVRVGGSYNVLDWNFRDLYAMEVESLKSTYEKVNELQSNFGEAYYYAAFSAGDKLFYFKVYRFNDILVSLTIEAPAGTDFSVVEELQKELTITDNN